jgi:hypothetical protein
MTIQKTEDIAVIVYQQKDIKEVIAKLNEFKLEKYYICASDKESEFKSYSLRKHKTEERDYKELKYINEVKKTKRVRKDKFKAIVQVNGKPLHLGRFTTREAANKVQDDYKKKNQ